MDERVNAALELHDSRIDRMELIAGELISFFARVHP
jgi:hypothetical protein